MMTLGALRGFCMHDCVRDEIPRSEMKLQRLNPTGPDRLRVKDDQSPRLSE